MTTIYIVETGSYSDRCVVGVFSTSELAEKARAMLRDAYVSEFVVDEFRDLLQSGLQRFYAQSKDGSVDVAHARPGNDFQNDQKDVWSNGRVMDVWILARDEAHAIKIAADKFREFVALNPPDWCKGKA